MKNLKLKLKMLLYVMTMIPYILWVVIVLAPVFGIRNIKHKIWKK
jgi:uncharacterized membrane protein